MAEREYSRDSEPPHSLERRLSRYLLSALAGVAMSAVTAGPVMYARFVAMEQSITQLTSVVDKLSTQVYQLKMEVVQLQTTNNLLNYEVKEHLADGPTKR